MKPVQSYGGWMVNCLKETTQMSYEQYMSWAAAQYPGYRQEETDQIGSCDTIVPPSQDSCPVTVRSSQNGVVVTPYVKGSK